MSDKKKEYREGDDSSEELVEEEEVQVPITAFLICLMPDGTVNVATDIGGAEVQRLAKLSDIRNLSMVVAEDARAQMISKQAAVSMGESLRTAVIRQKIANAGQAAISGLASIPTRG